ncbi:MAG TPA: hypothetical protein ENN74_02385, partial [Firmicutes bacterium]|nr:hypothetical protein [Bacillota bacterium]
MNPKQRVQAILDRQQVDRIPIDLWCSPEVFRSLAEHTGLEDEREIYRKLGVDKIFWIPAPYRGELRPPESAGETTTPWGCRLKKVEAGDARYDEALEPPLKEYSTSDALDDYPWWPRPECFDYDAMEREVERAGDEFATLGPWVSLFEIYCALRGFEQALMDTVLCPDWVGAALDRIEAIQTELVRRFLARAKKKPDMVFVSDDMGGQSGLLLSLETWRNLLGPRLRRWCDLIHSFGVRVFYHSDGAVAPVIPHLIEAGVDVLNPIQHACPGMERASLKERFGERLVFHGGVDNQSVLPFGSPAEVK